MKQWGLHQSGHEVRAQDWVVKEKLKQNKTKQNRGEGMIFKGKKKFNDIWRMKRVYEPV